MNKKGFTIIEVLVALALFTILSVTLFGSFRSYTSTIKKERESSVESVNLQQFIREIEEYIRMSSQEVLLTKVGNTYTLDDVSESIVYKHDRKIVLTGNTLTLYKEPTGKPTEFITMSKRIKSLNITVENNKLIIEIESTIVGMKKMIKQIQFRGQFRD